MGECPPIFLFFTKLIISFRRKFCLLAATVGRLINNRETRVQPALRRIGWGHNNLGRGEGGRSAS